MKIEFERDEVQTILCNYASNNLHIPANTMQIDGAGRAFLSYDRSLETQKPTRGLWTRLMSVATMGML